MSPSRRRGPWRLTWDRFRRDRLSLAALVLLSGIVLASFAGGPLASAALHHSSEDLFPYAVNENLRPVGLWTHVAALNAAVSVNDDGSIGAPPAGTGRTLFVLGADGPLGRDEFVRVLDGGKASLEIAVGGVLVALLIGVPLGCLAGLRGGLVDAAVGRFTEFVMAFPLILFLVLVSVRISGSLNPIGLSPVFPPGVMAEALLIGLFTWFYPSRLVRSQLLVLRNSEFVEAARMVGARDRRILRSHLFPHLLPILIVWGAVAVGTNLLLEVGISFLGVGVQPSTATWGSMLTTTWGTIFMPRTYDPLSFTPWQTLVPTLAILLTVVSLNQIGEGLRTAIDPKAHA
jgi:peptide/nickel transport system permease protein